MTEGASVDLQLRAVRIVKGGGRGGWRARVANGVLWALEQIEKPWRAIFPKEHVAGPASLTPGDAAAFDLAIRAPGLRAVHLYAEPTTVVGGVRLELAGAQAVPLDEFGRASVTVTGAPADVRESGRVRVRFAAVDPATPDVVAAERSDGVVEVAGTDRMIKGVIAAAFVIGIVGQFFLTAAPVTGILIAIALAFAWTNAPKRVGFAFRPAALASMRRRLFLALAVTLGFAGWFWMMSANLDGDVAFTPYCDEPGQRACGWHDSLEDNLTAIGAAALLSGFIFVALAPAFRPRKIAGYACMLSIAVPVMIYDFTLLATTGATTSGGNVAGAYLVRCFDNKNAYREFRIIEKDGALSGEGATRCLGDAFEPYYRFHYSSDGKQIGFAPLKVRPDDAPKGEYHAVRFTLGDDGRIVAAHPFRIRVVDQNRRLTIATPGGGAPVRRIDDEGAAERRTMLQTVADDPWVFAPAKAFSFGYAFLGWALAALGLAGLAMRQGGARKRSYALAAAVGLLVLPAAAGIGYAGLAGTAWIDELNSSSGGARRMVEAWLAFFAVLYLPFVGVAARLVLMPVGRRVWLRSIVFWTVFSVIGVGLSVFFYRHALIDSVVQPELWENLPALRPPEPTVWAMTSIVLMTLWCFVEVALWRGGRRGDSALVVRGDGRAESAETQSETAASNA